MRLRQFFAVVGRQTSLNKYLDVCQRCIGVIAEDAAATAHSHRAVELPVSRGEPEHHR